MEGPLCRWNMEDIKRINPEQLKSFFQKVSRATD
jgi:predicted Zn-dependent peptidase